MATSSFKRPFVIKDDKVADALILAMKRSRGVKRTPTDFDELVKRGVRFLEERSSR